MIPADAFGYVHFDFPGLPREGWLARHGQEPTRFSSPADIPSDMLFWTNLEWENFHRGSSLGRLGHLRHAGYLPVRPLDAVMELGIDVGVLGPDEMTRVCALIFGRVMSFASRLLSTGLPGLPEERQFTRGTLRDDLAALLADLEFPKGDEAHALVEGQSYHSVSSTLVPFRKEALRLVVRRPRLRHALDILSSPSPGGPWRFLLGSDLGDVNEVVESARPSLCRVKLRDADEVVADLYGFSNTISRDKRAIRSWAAQPELDVLRRLAVVDIEGGWVGESYRPLGAMLPEGVDDALGDRFARVSWSIGVCAEALWRAALVPPERPRKSRGSAFGGQPLGADISWQGLWARAADKVLLFPQAQGLSAKGYDVSSYGFGWIFCFVDEARVEEFIRDAASLGLLPRIADIPKALTGVAWGGAKLDLPLASLIHGKEIDRLLEVDAVAEHDPVRYRDVAAKALGAGEATDAT